jgi:hypothetical protein
MIRKIWWIKYFHNGKPICESAKTHKKMVAKKLLEKREGEISSGRNQSYLYQKVTIGELYYALEADYELSGRSTKKFTASFTKTLGFVTIYFSNPQTSLIGSGLLISM